MITFNAVNMNSKILIIILIACCFQCNNKIVKRTEGVEFINDRYKTAVRKFYEFLNKDEPISISDYVNLFGKSGIEEEESLWLQACETNTKENCILLVSQVLNNPSKSKSRVFEKIKNNYKERSRGLIDYDKIIDESSVKETGINKVKEIELVISDTSRVYVQLNGYEDEPPYIIDLYFTNGASVFNGIGIRENSYLKEIGIIDDPDGFTNVRIKNNMEGEVLYRIYKDQVFFFIPNVNSSWLKVQNIDSCEWGWMYRSRINRFGDLDINDQRRLESKIIYYFKKGIPCYDK